jgi:hypothetical protein
LFKQKIVAGEKETLSKELRNDVGCPFVSLDRKKEEKNCYVLHSVYSSANIMMQ